MALVICNNCGKKVSKKLQYTKKHKHHFCNNKCRGEWMRKHSKYYSKKNKKTWEENPYDVWWMPKK